MTAHFSSQPFGEAPNLVSEVLGAERRALGPRSEGARLFEELLRYLRKGFARVAEFAPTRLNFSWITDELAIGGAFRFRDIGRLSGLGIRAVVDCREESADDEQALARCGIAYLRLPTPDARGLTQEALREGTTWTREHLRAGRKVYIHCTHGVGRAPLLGGCVLVAQGYGPAEALHLVKARRWQASPNQQQLDALVEFAAEWGIAGGNAGP